MWSLHKKESIDSLAEKNAQNITVFCYTVLRHFSWQFRSVISMYWTSVWQLNLFVFIVSQNILGTHYWIRSKSLFSPTVWTELNQYYVSLDRTTPESPIDIYCIQVKYEALTKMPDDINLIYRKDLWPSQPCAQWAFKYWKIQMQAARIVVNYCIFPYFD